MLFGDSMAGFELGDTDGAFVDFCCGVACLTGLTFEETVGLARGGFAVGDFDFYGFVSIGARDFLGYIMDGRSLLVVVYGTYLGLLSLRTASCCLLSFSLFAF